MRKRSRSSNGPRNSRRIRLRRRRSRSSISTARRLAAWWCAGAPGSGRGHLVERGGERGVQFLDGGAFQRGVERGLGRQAALWTRTFRDPPAGRSPGEGDCGKTSGDVPEPFVRRAFRQRTASSSRSSAPRMRSARFDQGRLDPLQLLRVSGASHDRWLGERDSTRGAT